MPADVIMPHMGESVVEGKVLAWLKRPGERVEADEPLVEIETDKINVEVPSPAAGVLLKVLAAEGETVAVEQVIAVIGEPGEEAAGPPAEEAKAPPKPPPAAAPAEQPKPPAGVGTLKVLASPAVRRLARQLGVDLGRVEGTGRMGRITREDVAAVAEAAKARASASSPAAPAQPVTEGEDEELVSLTPMRRAIAEHMSRSAREAPHVTTVAEVDMTAVAALRERWQPRLAEAGVKLTYMAFVLNAVARALHEHPDLNSEWTDRGILIRYRIHLGIAVAVPDGLVVPVIRDADRLSILEAARAVQTLAERTRRGKVSSADMTGGTFTITNPGAFGAVISTPIIHQPQAAILAVGRIADAPAVVSGGLAVRKRVFLSLSYDHRIVDGATAVQFLQAVRRTLEDADFPEPEG